MHELCSTSIPVKHTAVRLLINFLDSDRSVSINVDHCGQWLMTRGPAHSSGCCEPARELPSAHSTRRRDAFLYMVCNRRSSHRKNWNSIRTCIVEKSVHASFRSCIDHGLYADLRLQRGHRQIKTKNDHQYIGSSRIDEIDLEIVRLLSINANFTMIYGYPAHIHYYLREICKVYLPVDYMRAISNILKNTNIIV